MREREALVVLWGSLKTCRPRALSPRHPPPSTQVELTTFAWVAEQALSFVKSPAKTRPSTSDSASREEWGEKEEQPKEDKAFYSVPDDIGSRAGGFTTWVYDALSEVLHPKPIPHT